MHMKGRQQQRRWTPTDAKTPKKIEKWPKVVKKTPKIQPKTIILSSADFGQSPHVSNIASLIYSRRSIQIIILIISSQFDFYRSIETAISEGLLTSEN